MPTIQRGDDVPAAPDTGRTAPAAASPSRPGPSLGRVLAVAAAAVTVAWLVVLVAWDDAPFAFTFDDAYYYAGIARNVAHGAGSTFDTIDLTNGYHPLWLLVATLPFLVGLDDLGAIRALLALQLVAGWGATLVIIGRILDRSVDGWSGVSRREGGDQHRARVAATVTVTGAFVLVALNPFVVKVFVNGLESGLSVTFLALLLLIGAAVRGSWLVGRSTRWRLGVGALLALAFLARTDAALLVLSLGVWCAADWLRAEPDDRGHATAALAALFALPAVTIAAYLVSNQVWFGTPFQVSGLVKRAELDAVTIAEFAVVVAIAVLIGARGRRATRASARRRRGARFPHTGDFVAHTAWYAASCVLVAGYYVVLQTQIWLWYFAPIVLYGIVLLLLAIIDMSEAALRDGRPEASPARRLLPVQAIFLALLVVALVVEAGSFRDPNLLSMQQADRDIGRWLQAHTAPDAVTASWDAGAVGYFSHRPVINLDGLVNSKEYYDAMQHGTTGAFLRCRRVQAVANHGDDIGGEDPSFRELIAAVYGHEAAAGATIPYRESFLFSGTTTGSAGTQSGGVRPVTAYVYQVPAAAVAAAGPC